MLCHDNVFANVRKKIGQKERKEALVEPNDPMTFFPFEVHTDQYKRDPR